MRTIAYIYIIALYSVVALFYCRRRNYSWATSFSLVCVATFGFKATRIGIRCIGLFVCLFKIVFSAKQKFLAKSPNDDVVISQHHVVLSQWQFMFHEFDAVHCLAESIGFFKWVPNHHGFTKSWSSTTGWFGILDHPHDLGTSIGVSMFHGSLKNIPLIPHGFL